MLENVAFFCESGGLDAIKDCFDSEKSEMPISLASCFISIIAQVSVLLAHVFMLSNNNNSLPKRKSGGMELQIPTSCKQADKIRTQSSGFYSRMD